MEEHKHAGYAAVNVGHPDGVPCATLLFHMCLVTTLLQENGHCWHLPSLLRQHCAEYFLPNLGLSYITTLL